MINKQLSEHLLSLRYQCSLYERSWYDWSTEERRTRADKILATAVKIHATTRKTP